MIQVESVITLKRAKSQKFSSRSDIVGKNMNRKDKPEWKPLGLASGSNGSTCLVGPQSLLYNGDYNIHYRTHEL